MGEAMTLGSFMKFLALCSYPAQGTALAGGGIAGLKSSGVLAQSAVPASMTGTLTETTLATVVIPAGKLSGNGALRIRSYWSVPNNANSKTLQISLGSSANRVLNFGVSASNTFVGDNFILNRQTQIAQITRPVASGPGAGSGAFTSMAVDLTQMQSLIFSGTLAVATDTITLEGYTVEILNP